MPQLALGQLHVWKKFCACLPLCSESTLQLITGAALMIANYLAGGNWLDITRKPPLHGSNYLNSLLRGKGIVVDLYIARDRNSVTLRAHKVRYLPGISNNLILVLDTFTLGSISHVVLKATWMRMVL